jgi:hypothetical protein
MLLTLWDLGLMLAILSIILLTSSLLLRGKSMINRRNLDLVGKIVSIAFLGVAFYLMWKSLA